MRLGRAVLQADVGEVVGIGGCAGGLASARGVYGEGAARARGYAGAGGCVREEVPGRWAGAHAALGFVVREGGHGAAGHARPAGVIGKQEGFARAFCDASIHTVIFIWASGKSGTGCLANSTCIFSVGVSRTYSYTATIGQRSG